MQQRGRHRYYKLADDDEVAHALEAVALMAERRTHTATWANPTRQRLRFARCCYGHLAGQAGRGTVFAALAKEWLTPVSEGYLLTAAGHSRVRWALRSTAWTAPGHQPPAAWLTAA